MIESCCLQGSYWPRCSQWLSWSSYFESRHYDLFNVMEYLYHEWKLMFVCRLKSQSVDPFLVHDDSYYRIWNKTNSLCFTSVAATVYPSAVFSGFRVTRSLVLFIVLSVVYGFGIFKPFLGQYGPHVRTFKYCFIMSPRLGKMSNWGFYLIPFSEIMYVYI
jgi:hypothetical protein